MFIHLLYLWITCELTFFLLRSIVVDMNDIHSSHDFFIQRSFEVVWAAFRVAEVSHRISFKALLEERALLFFKEQSLESLILLEQAITLGYRIGDIAPQNAKVLLREIEHLKEHIHESGNRNEEYGNEPVEIDLSSLFTSLPPSSESGNYQEEKDETSRTSFEVKREESDTQEGLKHESSKSPAKSGNVDSIKKSPANNVYREKSPAKSGNESLAKSGNSSPVYGKVSSVERKQVILSLLKDRSLCHMSDISDILPDISNRTLRYDVQSLVEKNLVERLGSGGPNSFIRLKQKEFQRTEHI